MDRAQLFDALSNLPTQDFERLLFAVKPPSGLVPSPEAPQINRVKALLDWAEGSSGQGIDKVQDCFDKLQNGTLPAAFDFSGYLQFVCEDPRCQSARDLYTETEVLIPLEAESVEKKSLTADSNREAEAPQQKVERFPVLEGLRKYALGEQRQHLLLAGRPGSGKSTTLKRLLLEQAKLVMVDSTQPVPIYIQLKRDVLLLESIANELEKGDIELEKKELKRLLRGKQLLLLLDGVNEIPSDEQRRKLQEFREDNPTAPMIFTTRDLAAGGDLGIEKRLEMRPLSETQMREFVQKYLPDHAEILLRQLKDRLREVAETPLLLRMLCDVFDPATGQIPQSKGELFRLFDHEYEKKKKNIEVVPVSESFWEFKSEVLQFLAFSMIQTDDLKSIEAWYALPLNHAEREIEKWLNSRDVTDAPTKAKLWLKDLLRCHLLQDAREFGEIEFHHQLFQEYYAAEYLRGLLPNLLKDEDKFKRAYLNLLKWTEAVALMLALVSDEDQAFQVVKLAIDDVDLMLGARLAGKVSSDLQKKSIEYLVKRIRQGKFSSINEIRILGKTQSQDAVPLLIERFTDKDNEELLFEIAFSLSQIGGQAVVENLSPLLSESSESIILAAIFALGKISSKKVLPILRDLAQHPSMHIREQVIEALFILGGYTVIPELRHALKDSSNEVREKAVEALGELKDKLSFSLLLEMATADHPISISALSLRLAAAEALGKIDPQKAKQELLKMSQSIELEYEICQNAVEALGQIGDGDSAIEELLVAINKPSNAWEAAEALIELGDKKAVPGLISALENSIPCEQAAYALGELGDPSAVPYLIKALDHWHPSVQEKAVEALGKIGDKEVIPELYEIYKSLENDLYNNLRSKTIIALGKLGDSRVREDLTKLLKRKWLDATLTRTDRIHVFEALKKVANSSTVLALIDLLGTDNSEDRWQAVEFLGDFGSEAIITDLTLMLNDENSTVQWKTVEALGKLEPQKVMSEIRMLLGRSQETRVQQAAIEVLGYFNDKLAISLLLEALADANSNIRCAAAESLTKLSGSDASSYIQRVLCSEFKNTLLNDDLTYLLERLQFNLNFYNYEIFQAHLAAQKADRQTNPNSDPNTITIQTLKSLTIMTDKAPIFHQQHAMIGVNYAAEGSQQDFTQHIHAPEQNFEILLTGYKHFIDELQQQNPHLASETAIIQAIGIEAQRIDTRWQNFLNLKRLWNGGKKAAIKVGEHFVESNPWGKGAIAFLEGVSEDVK